MARAFLGKKKPTDTETFIAECTAGHTTPIQKLIDDRRINFQEYADIKSAFTKGFALPFNSTNGFRSAIIADLKKLLRYRHRIVHVSPMLEMFNQAEVPPAKPDFPSASFAAAAKETYKSFVESIQVASLTLRTMPAVSRKAPGPWRVTLHKSMHVKQLGVYTKHLTPKEVGDILGWIKQRTEHDRVGRGPT